MTKPLSKHEMWYYTATKKRSRVKVKRAASKAARRKRKRDFELD